MGITIPFEARSKKNSQVIAINKRTGRPFVMPSKQFKEFEKKCKDYLPKLHIDYPVNIKCLFYMGTHRKCDLTNLLEAIDDCMVTAGTIEDDNFTIVAGHDGSRVLYDKENPRIEIWITEVN